MKKNVPIILSLLFIGSLIGFSAAHSNRENTPMELSVEALADQEYTVFGHCYKEEGSCMASCPFCHVSLISEPPTILGPAYDVNGTCPKCHQPIHFD